MKDYLWPLVLAIMVNALVIAGMLHLHHSQPLVHKKPAVVEVNLNQLVQHLNRGHIEKSGNAIVWLKRHYGKAINIHHVFQAGDALTGYVVSLKSDPDDKSIIYSVNHGEYYFMGTVINRRGNNISQANGHQYIAAPMNKTIVEQAKRLSGIVQGRKNTPQATIIIDPNSNLFPQQWNDLSYDITQGLFSVKWVLVDYLKPMGPNVANDVLLANDPLAALIINANHYNQNTQTGGYVKNLALNQQTKKTLMANWAFVQKFNLYHLPVTILQSNHQYYVIQGAVMDDTLETIFADAKQQN